MAESHKRYPREVCDECGADRPLLTLWSEDQGIWRACTECAEWDTDEREDDE